MHIFKEMKITDKLILYIYYSLTTRDPTKTKYMHGDLQVIGSSCEWGGGYMYPTKTIYMVTLGLLVVLVNGVGLSLVILSSLNNKDGEIQWLIKSYIRVLFIIFNRPSKSYSESQTESRLISQVDEFRNGSLSANREGSFVILN